MIFFSISNFMLQVVIRFSVGLFTLLKKKKKAGLLKPLKILHKAPFSIKII